jgi:hypothetical protein
MGSWIETFNDTFFLAIASVVAGSFAMSIRYCLKSKCSQFSLFWGLIRIERDIKAETQIELKQMEEGLEESDKK